MADVYECLRGRRNLQAKFEQGAKETPVRTQSKSEVLGKLKKICQTVAAREDDDVEGCHQPVARRFLERVARARRTI